MVIAFLAESNQTSSRAARSLAGYHFARDSYTAAIPYFEAALAINPLFARSWFILGCAYVKQESWKDAVRAFRRCTGIDEEDSEAWNNLASCYLRMPDIGGMVRPFSRPCLEHLLTPCIIGSLWSCRMGSRRWLLVLTWTTRSKSLRRRSLPRFVRLNKHVLIVCV